MKISEFVVRDANPPALGKLRYFWTEYLVITALDRGFGGVTITENPKRW